MAYCKLVITWQQYPATDIETRKETNMQEFTHPIELSDKELDEMGGLAG